LIPQAVVFALVGLLAGADAGFLASPAVVSAPVGIVRTGPVYGSPIVHSYAAPLAYSSPVVKTVGYSAPLVHAGHPGLVRVARSADPGLLAGPAVYSAPVGLRTGAVYASPVVHSYAAPLSYAAPVKTVAYSAPIVHSSPALVRVARSADPGLLAGPAVSSLSLILLENGALIV